MLYNNRSAYSKQTENLVHLSLPCS